MSQMGLNPFIRATDSDGNPLANARLYTFLTGTTTPAAVYTTSALSVSHGAYVQANSAGLYPAFYLDPTVTYRYQTRISPYTAAVAGMDFDPVSGFSSSDITYTRTGSGSVTRTITADLDSRPVRLSQKGTTADMDGALADVFTALAAGGVAEIDAGTWTLAATASFPGTRLHLQGEGEQVTIISFAPAGADVALEYLRTGGSAATGVEQSSISGLGFAAGANTSAKTAIRLVNVAQCDIDHIATTTAGWLGDSIVFDVAGRQLIRFRSCTPSAARPFVFRQNATFTSLTADHSFIESCEITGTSATRPCIEFETGCVISNFTLRGSALVGGRDGVSWLDTTSVAASTHMHIADVRGEQGLAITGTVTGATQANPAVITTSAAHGLAVGDAVGFASVGGMTQLNSNVYIVGTVPTTTSFSLLSIDSSGYGAYTTGGTFTSYGYLVRMESTGQSLRELLIENVRFGEDRNGVRLRNVHNPRFVNCTFNQTSNKKAVDITMVSGGLVRFESCYGAGGFKITNGRPVDIPQAALTNHFSMTFVYEANATYEDGVFTPGTTYEAGARHTSTWLTGKPFSLADTVTKTLALNTFCGTVLINNHTDGSSAIFSFNGVANTATKLTESAANLYVLDNALGTASRVNVGYSSGFKILNNLGGTKTFSVLMLGGLAT